MKKDLTLLPESPKSGLFAYNLNRIISITLFVFASCCETGCQRSISPQAQHAVDFFDNHQYSSAVTEFRKLIEKYPKDPLYQFYLGASLVELNSSPLQANECLKTAITKNKMIKAWFYLGKNYYRQFRFNESEKAYNEFIKNATWQENRTMSASGEPARIKHAVDFFTKAIQLSIKAKMTTFTDSIKILIYPVCNCQLQGSANTNKTGIINLKNRMNVGDYYYYADQSRPERGKDIFKIKKISDSTWSEPQNLGSVINSSEDEDYPNFVKETGTLYFASKGHQSVGGFDIFKSVFDSVKMTWSNPQQLPFPINTPWDDYYWIENGNSVCFASNRENLLGKATIYQISNPISNETISISGTNEMLQTCMLKMNELPSGKDLQIINYSITKNDTESSTVSLLANLVAEALEKQKKCDSAIIDSKKCKLILENLSDKEKRAVIFSRIKQDEKYSSKMQTSVNLLYTKINALQKNGYSSQTTNNDSIKSENYNFSIDDTTIYSELNPIPSDTKVPPGIVYRIQLGVYSKQIDYKLFGGIQPVSIEILQDKKIIKYYAGMFKYFTEADNSLNKVKEHGFKEAFIVAYYNSRKIPVERAKEFEKNQ